MNKLYSLPLYRTSISTSEYNKKVSSSISDTIVSISAGLNQSVNIGYTNANKSSEKKFRKGFAQSFQANYFYKKTKLTKQIFYYLNHSISVFPILINLEILRATWKLVTN